VTRTERLIAQERLRKKRWEKFKKSLAKRKRHVAAAAVNPVRRNPEKITNPTLAFLREKLTFKGRCVYNVAAARWELRIPKVFSLISNTEETLEIISSLITVSRHFKPLQQIHIDHSSCEEMDLAASAIFDVATLAILKEFPSGTFNLTGEIPKSGSVRRLMIAMGLPRQLNINIPRAPDELILDFPLKKGSKQSPGNYQGVSDAERIASDLANHLRDCFRRAAGFELPLSVTRQVLKWLPEVIGNAEDHSETDEWWAISYLAPHNQEAYSQSLKDGGDSFLGECQLAVFGFGRSFYESLSAPDTAPGLKTLVGELAKKHSQMGWFTPRNYTERDLWTLYALQDGVSRFADVPGTIDRGWGTVRMIQAFQRLGSTLTPGLTPKMVLISGDTLINFDSKYQLKEQAVANGEREIIAFNEGNTLEQRPDRNYVRSLRSYFPGTLLAFRFFIDKANLERMNAPNT
jgi:hypothetical protein